MNINPLTAIDFYKADHRRQYPEGTEVVYSNWTPRSTKYAYDIPGVDKKVVFFGLQYFIKWFCIEVFNREFFEKDKDFVVARYKRRLDNALGPDAVPVEHIGALHDLGYLPISIRALPEGVCVKERVAMLTIENTDPRFFWLTNYLETIMSNMLWVPCTSASTARCYRQILDFYARETGGAMEFVPFQGHDFSFRGMGLYQSAMLSGMGHLTGFVGTDTVCAIDGLEDYYGADVEKELVGCSVPATEHSCMCMGSKNGEFATFKRLITELYPNGIVSIVSDTWDFWQVVTDFLPQLKKEILAREGHPIANKVVIRPDSGDPVRIICGYGDHEVEHDGDRIIVKQTGEEIAEAEFKGAIQCLWDTFGGSVNKLGYKELDPHIGLIYGDSITLQRCTQICRGLKRKGFASTNVVLGIGSFTYQYVTRDTYGFAMKATAGQVDGEFREIFKDPKTDGGMKKSAKGYLAVFKGDDGEYIMIDQVSREVMENSELKEVFRDGKLLVEHTLAEIRKRVNASIKF